MISPITPAEAASRYETTIPDFVFEAFNRLIISQYDGLHATTVNIKQNDVIELILEIANTSIFHHTPEITKKMLFDNNWLDIELVYRKAGWTVSYDKPGFGGPIPRTSYEPSWTFKKALNAQF